MKNAEDLSLAISAEGAEKAKELCELLEKLEQLEQEKKETAHAMAERVNELKSQIKIVREELTSDQLGLFSRR